MPGIDDKRPFVPLKIAVLTVSDTRELADDKSGSTLAERIEKARTANAISRPDLLRFTAEMGRVVERHVTDAETLNKIKDGWMGIRLV